MSTASAHSELDSPGLTPVAYESLHHTRPPEAGPGLSPAQEVLRQRDRQVSVRRQRLALLQLLLAGAALYGMVWDIQWHHDVGRDRLLTPPHILLFSGIALSGFSCLMLVLWESWLARKGEPALNPETTVTVLGIFRAPLGLVMAGFGHLLSGCSAPLDNYWHYLYGLDVQLWSPFHVMGFIGQSIATLGLICLLASESTRAFMRGELAGAQAPGKNTIAPGRMVAPGRVAASGRYAQWFHPTQVALMMGIAGITTLLLLMTITAATWPDLVVKVAGQPLFLYPILVGFFLPFGLVLSLSVRAPFAATSVAIILLLSRAFMVQTLPIAVETLRAMEELIYRPDSPFPPLPLYFIPPPLLLSALLVDGYRWYQERKARLPAFWTLGLCAVLPVLFLWRPYLSPSGPRSQELLAQLAPQLPSMLAASLSLGLLLSIPSAHASTRVVDILRRISR